MITESESYLFSITQQDLDEGANHLMSTTKCPLARCMRRQLKDAVVGVSTAYANKRKLVFFFPDEVVRTLAQLVGGEKIEPFSFEVRGNIYV